MPAKNIKSGFIRSLVFLTFVTLMPTSLMAAGFRLPNQAAFATARGNAFVATADDASAVYYNAAGLTQLDENQLQLGLYVIDFDVDFKDSGSTYSNENVWQPIPQVFYAHQFESFSAGLGIYAPFGLGNEWGNDSPFPSLAIDAAITYLTLAPVAAIQLSESLSVGGGLTLNYAKLDIEQSIGFLPGDRLRFVGSDTSTGWTLSAMWEVSEKHQFGLNYRSSVAHDLRGNTDVSFIPASTKSTFSIDIPEIVSLGYSFRPTPAWNIEADLEWGGWESLSTPLLENTPLGDLPRPFEWQNGVIYQLGATRYFENYALSFGYDLNESVQTEGNYNPAVSDADRNWLNLGVSKLGGEYPWTVTYQYGWSSRGIDQSIPNPQTLETANGTFDTAAHALVFSLGIRL